MASTAEQIALRLDPRIQAFNDSYPELAVANRAGRRSTTHVTKKKNQAKTLSGKQMAKVRDNKGVKANKKFAKPNKPGKKSTEKKLKERTKEREEETKIERDFPSYGPVMAVDHRGSPNDDTSILTFKFNARAALNAVAGIVAHGLAQGGDTLSALNSAYAVRFLYDYLVNVGYRIPQLYELDYAPAVFWDMVDALSPRRSGAFTFQCQTSVSISALSTMSTANQGTGFGTAGSTTFGYVILDPSLTGYSSLAGWTATNLLFAGLGKALDCVKRLDYMEIKATDPCAYSVSMSANDGTNGESYRHNGTWYNYVKTMQTVFKSRCEWITRIGFYDGNGNLAAAVADNHIRVNSAPATIVVDRILNRLRGYQEHKRQAMVKMIDGGTWFQVFDYLAKQAETASGTTPFNGLNFNEYKLAIMTTLSRWCANWAAVATGQSQKLFGTNGRYLGIGFRSTPLKGALGLRNFTVLEENLSFLYPYCVKNVCYYPVPHVVGDINVSPNTVTTAATGLLTTAWNYVSNIANSNEVADYQLDTSVWNGILKNWNAAMQACEPYILTSGMIDESRLNLTCTTAILSNSSSSGYLMGWSMLYPMKDHIYAIFERCLVPISIPNVTANDSSTDTLNAQAAVQIRFKEHYYMGCIQPTTFQSDLIKYALLPAVHKLGGNGDPLGNLADNDDEENYSHVGSRSPKQDQLVKTIMKNASPLIIGAIRTGMGL